MDFDLIIIGGGPAGLSAALYAVRAGLETAVITKQFGGRILLAHKIENYLGSGVLTGEEFMQKSIEQVKQIGAQLIEEEVMDCEVKDGLFCMKTSKEEQHKATALIIATGIQDKSLKIPGEKELVGKGVSYCATCDGYFFKEQNVVVVGSGNAAFHAALFLKNLASDVRLITPEELSIDQTQLDKLKSQKIETIKGKVQKIEGENEVTGIVVDGKSIPTSGVFMELGTTSTLNLAAKLGVLMKDARFIQVDSKQATNVPGVYAAGDVTGGLLQIVTAVYQGAVAALSARTYINSKKTT